MLPQSMYSIIGLFDFAAEQLEYPKLKFLVHGRTIQLQRCGNKSRTPGCVSVTDGGRYQHNTYYGRINRDGSWRINDERVETFLLDFATDPINKAAIYGKQTGNCCFCAKLLTDERSVSVGYGPICAGHWNLPWGDHHRQDFTPRQQIPTIPQRENNWPLNSTPIETDFLDVEPENFLPSSKFAIPDDYVPDFPD